MAEAGGWAGVVHAFRVSAEQRLHLAALLIVCTSLLVATPAAAQNDIDFDPTITQAEFEQFSRLVAQGIYATPVDAARARGLMGFDIGVAATAIPVDTNAAYWQKAVGDDFTVSDHVVVPRLVASKGLSVATLSASYAQVPSTDITIWGASLDVPILGGGITMPTVAVRGAYATLSGSDELDLKTYGAELFISKGFGPITPYAAVGRARSDAEAHFFSGNQTPLPEPEIRFRDQADSNRITVGVKLSLFIPKIVVEATQGEERSYAAKVSFGL